MFKNYAVVIKAILHHIKWDASWGKACWSHDQPNSTCFIYPPYYWMALVTENFCLMLHPQHVPYQSAQQTKSVPLKNIRLYEESAT